MTDRRDIHRSVFALVAAAAGAQAAPPGWSLVFEDEFDGPALDTSVWEPMLGDGSAFGIPGWGNNELQYYTAREANVRVIDGKLQIRGYRENFGGKQYTSARLRTIGNLDFTYGRIEGRIRVPAAQGMWPAFWMLPTNNVYGGWAASGEIDIVETRNFADVAGGTIHFGGQWPDNTLFGVEVDPNLPGSDNLGDGFHTYAIEWEPDAIRWFLDGQQYLVAPSSVWFSQASGGVRAPFDQDFHLLINLALGGNYPGVDPAPSTQWPQTLEAEYVRVYEAVQEPFNGAPLALPGVLQAEEFDHGYETLAYEDNNADNNGGAFRDATGVDIEATSGGGFNVGWLGSGEWMEYTVNVTQAGTYQMTARVASPTGNGAFRLLADGADVSGDVPVPVTGGWQSWEPITHSIDLNAGEQVLRFEVRGTGDRFNIDSIEFELTSPAVECVGDVTATGATLFGQPGFGEPDGLVDADDLGYFLSFWTEGVAATADLTTTGATLAGQPGFGQPDGLVDADDLGFFLSFWLSGCS